MPIQMVSGVGQSIARGTIIQSDPKQETEQAVDSLGRGVGDLLTSSYTTRHRPLSYEDRRTGGQAQVSGSPFEWLGFAIGRAMGRYDDSVATADVQRAAPEEDLAPTEQPDQPAAGVEVPEDWRGQGLNVDVRGQ